ncbi:MAG: alpha/beta hydrolase [Sphingomonadales bacterium]|nr:alpha/beta hydrolase [Sphingomonadales bacterium]
MANPIPLPHATKPLILLIPDRDDGADDWMAIWEREDADTSRIDLGMWENPHRNTWVNRINLAIERAGRPVVLVARGLACVAVAWWAEFEQPAYGDPVAFALLVSPPDVSRPGTDPRLARFTSCPRQPLPFRSFLVAGSRRPVDEQAALRSLAHDWESAFIGDSSLGHAGLVDDARDWPTGRGLLGHLLRLVPVTPPPFAAAPAQHIGS